ncbi:MAG: carbohydrate ABC transporter permease [Bacilli bacterium]
MNKKNLTPYLLILPVVLFMLIIYGYPLLLTFKYSFNDVSLIGDRNTFIGLYNYIDLLSDSEFYKTIVLTLKWVLLAVTFKIGIGFILALLLNGKIYLKKLYRVLIIIPWAIPQVAVAILWSWILDSRYGYLNYFIELFGYDGENIAWLANQKLAVVSTAFVDAWIGIPLITMIFLSAFGTISPSLYEAAKIDGANALKRFIWITIPEIKKVFLVTATLTTIWTFNSFNIIYVLTGGGPLDATEVLNIKIYKEAFEKYNLGMSSTISILAFIILTTLSMIYWKEISKEKSK